MSSQTREMWLKDVAFRLEEAKREIEIFYPLAEVEDERDKIFAIIERHVKNLIHDQGKLLEAMEAV